MTYQEKLRDPRWQKLRLQVLERDCFQCQYCGDMKTELHIHHFCYPKSRNPWDSDLTDLITYCKHCHEIVEELKRDNASIVLLSVKKIFTTERIYIILCCVLYEGEKMIAQYEYHERLELITVISSKMLAQIDELLASNTI